MSGIATSEPRRRVRRLGRIRPGKFVMFVIDSLLMGEVLETLYTITAIECKKPSEEQMVRSYARQIWEEPDATRWVAQRVVRLYDRSVCMEAQALPRFSSVFVLERTEERHYKYAEFPERGESDHGGCLYVQTQAFGDVAPPGRLTVTVAATPDPDAEREPETVT